MDHRFPEVRCSVGFANLRDEVRAVEADLAEMTGSEPQTSADPQV
jgi:hypothetical protein